MEPFVAYAAPRVDAATRAGYLRDWEDRLLAAAGDRDWHARTIASAAASEKNRAVPEGAAWAAKK
jgi:hypothetical protein